MLGLLVVLSRRTVTIIISIIKVHVNSYLLPFWLFFWLFCFGGSFLFDMWGGKNIDCVNPVHSAVSSETLLSALLGSPLSTTEHPLLML